MQGIFIYSYKTRLLYISGAKDNFLLSIFSVSSLYDASTAIRSSSNTIQAMEMDRSPNDAEKISRKQRRAIRSIRAGSSYIKNYRMSRYNNALYSSIPFRRSNVSTKEIPVDSVGCFSNATFYWVRGFHQSSKNTKKNTTTLPTVSTNEADGDESLPKCAYTDSCSVNAKRSE